uniref:Uncharacterized protein n=1 Tax=Tryblionella apiculata TaxID=1003145 RepID=A0A8F1B805_9STRA|nr:hypothetical protein KYU77_pgp131 [Tryblionella apiculata]QWM93465.1 hypothetical protein [Tryblionella apiculata]
MSSLLYYSISSDLTEDEIIEIDKQVKEVYLFLTELPSNSKGKAKRLFVYVIFLFQLGQPLIPCAAGVMIPLPPAINRLSPIKESITRIQKNYTQTATIPESKVDKIRLTNEQIKQFNNLALQLNSGSITMEEAVLELRGGDGLTDVVAVLAFIIFVNWYDSFFGAEAFQANPLPHQDPFGWLSRKYDFKNVGPSPSRPTTNLEMEKPASMPQQQYSGMTKSERRQLPDPRGRDGFIEVEGYPRLNLRFNQVEFKTPKHGPDHGLYVDSNGKTPKTEAITLRDSLIDMPNRQNIIWYTDGQYQGGTTRRCDCVNLFDQDTNLIAVYQKQPGGSNLFLTTCKLTQMERDHFMATNGNFVTEKVLNEQSAVSTNIQDNTDNNNGLQ